MREKYVIDFQSDFFLTLGYTGFDNLQQAVCVLLSRTMKIVTILIIVTDFTRLFLRMQLFYLFFFRDQSSNLMLQKYQKILCGKKTQNLELLQRVQQMATESMKVLENVSCEETLR